MAFRVKRPFNLLFLEEGEEYFSDFATSVFINKREVLGRLRVCSKSLVFDPDDTSAPILKFLYRHVQRTIADRNGKPVFKLDVSTVVKVTTTTAALKTRCVTPYAVETVGESDSYIFSVHYAEIDQFFPLIESLRGASSLPLDQHAEKVQAMLSKVSGSLTFDQSQLDHRESLLLPKALWVTRIKPLMCHRGLFLVTNTAVYYQPYPNFSSKPVKRIKLQDILQVFPRHYSLQPTALEIVTSKKKGLFIRFESEAARNQVQQILLSQVQHLPAAIKQLTDIRSVTSLWQRGALSNYHYLDFLNCAAGRSRNDLSQYPVFPWVVTDYTSRVLDLDNPNSYRDLSKPVGALNPKRLKYFQDRLNTMTPEETFLYGTHYSNPSYVLYWLLRTMPECMLRLHGGKFDASARLFHSMEGSWSSCFESTSTLMELVPEFFELPMPWLFNSLGIKPRDAPITDVTLPPWAKDAEDFVVKMRAALESEAVSRALPGWIDLIFGVSSAGGGRHSPAFKAANLFHPACYAAREFAKDPVRAQQQFGLPQHILEAQVTEFGSVPQQLFSEPHPPRLAFPKWDAQCIRTDTSSSAPWHVAIKSCQSPDAKPSLSAPASDSSHLHRTDRPTAQSQPFAGRPAGFAAGMGAAAIDAADYFVEREVALNCCDVSGFATSSSIAFAAGSDGGLRSVPYQDKSPEIPSQADAKSSFSQRLLQRRAAAHKTFHVSPMPLTAVAVLDQHPSLVCIGGADDAVTIYSIMAGRHLHRQVLHSDTVSALCSDGDLIASGSSDQTVRSWRFADGQLREVDSFDDLQDSISTVAVSGHTIAAGSDDGCVAIWDSRSGKSLFSRTMGPHAVRQVHLSAASGQPVAGGLDIAGQFLLWDLRMNNEMLCVRAPNDTISAITDCKSWALFGGQQSVHLWSLVDQQEVSRVNLNHAADFLSAPPNLATHTEMVACSRSGHASFIKA